MKREPLQHMTVDECVHAAIVEQVRQDDLREWANKPSPKIPRMQYLKHPQPSRSLMRHLLLQWLP